MWQISTELTHGSLITTVTVHEPGTPWPIKFHFVRENDEPVSVGFEIGEHEITPDVEPVPIEPIDAAAVQRIATNYVSYLAIATNAIIIREPEALEHAIRRLRGTGVKPAKLNDDFFRLVAADYDAHRKAGLPPGKSLAAKYTAHPSAVSRWIKTARERGYIKEES